MPVLPRVAIGSVQPGVDLRPFMWALLESLDRAGINSQPFFSDHRLVPVVGRSSCAAHRHLDSWLMPRKVCRRLFLEATRDCELGIVEGTFCDPPGDLPASRLNVISRWLDLPRIAVIDARQLAPCSPSGLSDEFDAVFFDRVQSLSEFCRLQTLFESLWKIPVIGWLDEAPAIRPLIVQRALSERPARELCQALADELEYRLRIDRLLEIAARRPADWAAQLGECKPPEAGRLRVAVALDDAFNCYYPDTLDLLELCGARLLDFSPLRSERLPARTDLVYLGCGHPHLSAARLSANCCLRQSLRDYARKGGRVYAECAGLAYLCDQLLLPDGRRYPMTGILPATARLRTTPASPEPVEFRSGPVSWLLPRSAVVRGYTNTAWAIEANEPCDTGRYDQLLMTSGNVVGSRVHLNFAAQASLLQGFFHAAGSV